MGFSVSRELLRCRMLLIKYHESFPEEHLVSHRLTGWSPPCGHTPSHPPVPRVDAGPPGHRLPAVVGGRNRTTACLRREPRPLCGIVALGVGADAGDGVT